MRLGILALQFIAHVTRTRFDSAGRPLQSPSGALDQFFVHREIDIDRSDPLGWLIKHCRDFGYDAVEIPSLTRFTAHHVGVYASGLSTEIDYTKDPRAITRLRELSEEHGVMLTTDYHDNFAAPTRSLDEFRQYVEVARELGAEVIGIGAMPFTMNRFVTDPPFSRQMEMVNECVKPWTEIAERAGVRLALENHADYRASELMEHVVEPIDSPYLGIKLDTGNCMVVLEDPVEAARAVASKCFDTHFKDVFVHPYTPRGGILAGAPIGRGHAQLDVVAGILAESAPDPDRLSLTIEFVEDQFPPEDFVVWFEASAQWCNSNLSSFLGTSGSRETS